VFIFADDTITVIHQSPKLMGEPFTWENREEPLLRFLSFSAK
jgi:hypothetical protein